MVKTKKISPRLIASLVLITLADVIFFLTIWLGNKYDKVSLDQVIYQMKAPGTGANRTLVGSAFIQVGLYGVLLTLFFVGLYLLLTGAFKRQFHEHPRYIHLCNSKFAGFVTKYLLRCCVIAFLVSTFFFVIRLNVFTYVDNTTTESGLIEREYVDPNEVGLQFPEKKRNLIYIFLESMEVTFSDPSAGGPITDNFIPELTELAQEYVNFSNDEGVGGALSFSGTTWTAAAMVTQTSGMIVQVPLTAETYGGSNEYIPGIISIGELLEEEGYEQSLLVGSNAEFHGRESYFSEHGNFNILDTQSLKEAGRLDEDYDIWWGFEDEKLYSFAKEEITRLSQSGVPFNFTMLTCDSHFPNGYVCRLCEDKYSGQYPNVLACSSKQLYDFVSWIQEQPFYEDTTIVICGDHLTMDPNFLREADEDYVRTVYNCIINSAVEPINEKNREFGTFDMFPTTLAAMGVTIPGNRLGLGTNLFSDKPTLAEHYTFEILNNELQKNSEFYNTKFLHMASTAEED